jgi:DNA-directed RNA polymerase subunit RPC12/RpoP
MKYDPLIFGSIEVKGATCQHNNICTDWYDSLHFSTYYKCVDCGLTVRVSCSYTPRNIAELRELFEVADGNRCT